MAKPHDGLGLTDVNFNPYINGWLEDILIYTQIRGCDPN